MSASSSDLTCIIFRGASGSGKSWHTQQRLLELLERKGIEDVIITYEASSIKIREPTGDKVIAIICSADIGFSRPKTTYMATTFKELSLRNQSEQFVDHIETMNHDAPVFDKFLLNENHKMCRHAAWSAAEEGIELIIINNTNTTDLECRPYAALEKVGYNVVFETIDFPGNSSQTVARALEKRNSHGVKFPVIQSQLDRLAASRFMSVSSALAAPRPVLDDPKKFWIEDQIAVYDETDEWLSTHTRGQLTKSAGKA